ncbi:hypothetical protein ACI0FR_03273 [Paenochrobactrum sp. BZR 201-1]
MVDRIIFDASGVRVSKPGFDANTASPQNMAMFSGMTPCIPITSNSVSFTGNGTKTFTFTSPNQNIVPTVLVRSPQGILPSFRTYYAEMNAPFNSVTIRNVDGKARTVEFKVLF